jgi:hypothetical protein
MPVILLGSACENPFGGDCVTVGVFGISVTVIDAVTKAAPSAIPVVRASDGAFVEELTAPQFPGSGPPQYSLAVERPGVYRVHVKAAGYQDFALDDVRVTRGGDCNYLRPARFTVSLSKVP